MVKTKFFSQGNVYIVNGNTNCDANVTGAASLHSVSASRKSLRNALQELGFNVMSFKGPTVFVREFKTLHELQLALPAVLLFDTRLHDWSGVALQFDLSQLRHPVPMIFLGANDDAKEIVTAMKQGAVDFLAG
jgi:FixJ family two-component response regulator